jgi:cell division transport system permease protein
MKSAFKSFVRSWQHHPTLQSATLSVLVGTFAMIAFFFCAKTNLSELLAHWGQTVQMTVYLKDENGPQVQAVADRLHKMDEFESVTFIDKAEAARRFRTQMGSYSAGFMSDPDFGNPLPASFEVKLKDAFNSPDLMEHMSAVVKSLTDLQGVDEVSYGQGWVENYHVFLRSFDKASVFVVIVLLFGAVFIIAHSIRSSIYQRREEIEILELVGATSRTIRIPFMFEGALLGFLASTLALVICYGFLNWQFQIFQKTLQIWGLTSVFRFLNPFEIAIFVTMGTFFGWFGAYISLRNLATGWAAAERTEL